jgi:hypothetical protein
MSGQQPAARRASSAPAAALLGGAFGGRRAGAPARATRPVSWREPAGGAAAAWRVAGAAGAGVAAWVSGRRGVG